MHIHPKSIALGALAAALTIGSGTAPAAAGDPPRKYVRQSLHEFFKDPRKVESLIRGVREMKLRSAADSSSAEFRTSWKYWANIHGYVGIGPNAGLKRDGRRTLKEVREVYRLRAPAVAQLFDAFYSLNGEIKDEEPVDQLAKDTWGMCPHGSDFFLPWHRIYLYFFERTLRKASGDPDLALPYWDYTNAETFRGPDKQLLPSPWMIPEPYVVSELVADTPNPLFETRRTAGFGETVHVNLEVTKIDSVLRNDKFFDKFLDEEKQEQDRGFQRTLESGLHGEIHCLVGNRCLAPYIGLVAMAANDLVFWHHHANLDRLWSCWARAWGESANPIKNETWMKQTYVFPDENGERKSMDVRELFDPNGRIDFTYDNETDCLRDKTQVVAGAPADGPAATPAAAPVPTTAGSASDVRVTSTDQRVPLAVPAAAAAAVRDRLATAARSSGPQWRRALLTLTGVTTDGAPGASTAVYLENVKTGKRAFAGVMSFFHDGGHEHEGGGSGNSFGFEVSSQLQELVGDGGSEEGLQVALVASGQVVGTPEATSTRLYENAGLRIGQIKLLLE